MVIELTTSDSTEVSSVNVMSNTETDVRWSVVA